MTKIREGYKETELGVIPEDWDVIDMNKLIWFQEGPGLRKWQWKTTGMKVINVTNLTSKYLDLSLTNKFIDIDEANSKYPHFQIDVDDIVVASSGNSWGKVSVVREIDLPLLMNTSVIRFKGKEGVNQQYLYQFLLSGLFKNQIKSLITGSAQPNFGPFHLNKTLFIKPPLPEQQRIAEILSTTDAHIEKLDKIIEDYKLLKKGMMKKLLTEGIGHTEFKETEIGRIPKEWEVKTLGEISKYRRGSFPQPYGNPEWYDDENGFPFVQVYDIDDNFKLKTCTKRRISKQATEMSVFAEKGTILVTLQGSIGKTAITQYDAYIDRTLLLFTEFKFEFDKYFFLFVIDALFNVEKNKADGGVIKTITKESLTKFLIPIPSIEEQKLIAETLETITKPLNLMIQDLEDYKVLKKTLMEKLLKGKIRVI